MHRCDTRRDGSERQAGVLKNRTSHPGHRRRHRFTAEIVGARLAMFTGQHWLTAAAARREERQRYHEVAVPFRSADSLAGKRPLAAKGVARVIDRSIRNWCIVRPLEELTAYGKRQ